MPLDGLQIDDDDDDDNSFTEDLDQIGRLNLLKWPALISADSLPSLPSFDLADVLKYISQQVHSATRRLDLGLALPGLPPPAGPGEPGPGEQGPGVPLHASVANSVRTAVATRIQMASFLRDLKGGRSLQAALARLQPISRHIHEAMGLPFGDERVPGVGAGPGAERDTEPGGVGAVADREQPFVGDLVLPVLPGLPECTHEDGVLPGLGSRRTRRRHRHAGGAGGGAVMPSDECTTDLDSVDELTRQEAEALTHLDSLDDFFDEAMLRRKIQRIHTAGALSLHLKNKLVTKLMMGNYYKYINERMGGASPGGSQGGTSAASVAQTDLGTSDPAAPATSRTTHGTTAASVTASLPASLPASVPAAPLHLHEYDSSSDDEVVLTPQDTTPSYYDKAAGILGCRHYQRNCKLECPTCLKWFSCRFCHDADVASHKLDRSAVRHILCMRCNTPQVPDTNYCVNCEEELANYFCRECVLYDNDASKDIYHCARCGICRLGLGIDKDYFHCDTCNICLSIDLREHHRCVANTTHCNCPICNEYLFTSVSKVVFMKCGHLIHQACYDEMLQHSYRCPVCKKTVVNTDTQFRILDQEIRLLPLPAPYDKWRCVITCNDCKGKSNCAYHILGLKCRYCSSYNTHQVKLIKPESPDDDPAVHDSDDDEAAARITSMRLVKTNLSSNFVIDEQPVGDGARAADSDYFGDDYDDADDMDEDIDTDEDNDDMATMVNMKRLTRAVLGENNVDRTSILEMFQNFINATIADIGDAGTSD